MLPSLLAVIAIDLGVSIVTIGSFLAVARLAGLAAPLAGWLVERSSPLQVLVASLGGFFLAAIALATAPTIWIFGPALVGLAVVSIGYEASATAWISSVAPTNSRTRFLARLDLAWSLGLLIGVPIATTLAGVSWRLAYCATGILAVAVLLRLRRGGELIVAKNVVPSSVAHGTSWVAIARSSWATFAAFGFLSGAAQLVVVVFGVWLSDEFSFAVASIGQVAFLFGVIELLAVAATIRFADRIGSTRSALGGTAILVAAAMLLAFGSTHLAIGVGALSFLLAGHEFALVSTKPLLAAASPGEPGVGIGLGFAAAAAARSIAVLVGTIAFQSGGMTLAATLSGGLGLLALSLFGFAHHSNTANLLL